MSPESSSLFRSGGASSSSSSSSSSSRSDSGPWTILFVAGQSDSSDSSEQCDGHQQLRPGAFHSAVGHLNYGVGLELGADIKIPGACEVNLPIDVSTVSLTSDTSDSRSWYSMFFSGQGGPWPTLYETPTVRRNRINDPGGVSYYLGKGAFCTNSVITTHIDDILCSCQYQPVFLISLLCLCGVLY